jgi:hypothetical protein
MRRLRVGLFAICNPLRPELSPDVGVEKVQAAGLRMLSDNHDFGR